MPTVTPNSPDEFTPFASEEAHVRAHRGLERAVENIEVAVIDTISVNTMTVATLMVSGSASANTVSTNALVVTNATVGSASVSTQTVVTLTVTGTEITNTTSTTALVATRGTIGSESVSTSTIVTLTVTGTAITNTLSTVALIATVVGFGAPASTSSTAAVVKGFYRTAAPIGVAVPAITMLGITTVTVTQTFSVERQIGNAIQVGDPVVLVPTTALPANVGLGGAWCSDTNSITVAFVGRTAATITATFTTHIFTADLT